MSADANKAIARRIFDEIANNRKMDVVDELFSTGYIYHESSGHELHGPEGFKQLMSHPHSAFPDFHITAEDFIAEGDKVVCRFTIKGTHNGVLMGIPPTGKPFTMTGIVIYRIVDGKVIEHWENMDFLGMMQQIGVLPSPGQGKD